MNGAIFPPPSPTTVDYEYTTTVDTHESTTCGTWEFTAGRMNDDGWELLKVVEFMEPPWKDKDGTLHQPTYAALKSFWRRAKQ